MVGDLVGAPVGAPVGAMVEILAAATVNPLLSLGASTAAKVVSLEIDFLTPSVRVSLLTAVAFTGTA